MNFGKFKGNFGNVTFQEIELFLFTLPFGDLNTVSASNSLTLAGLYGPQ